MVRKFQAENGTWTVLCVELGEHETGLTQAEANRLYKLWKSWL